MAPDPDPDLEAGRAALRAGRWEAARASFEASAARQESAEALDGAAEALWWLCRARDSVRLRERAYVLYAQAGAALGAARAAVDLSICHLVNLGQDAAARGWLARAERVSAGVGPNPLQGWLWLMRAYLAEGDDGAGDLIERAIDFARAAGDVDLELVARADLGLALVMAGRVDEGLASLDEAMAGTLGGEYRRLDTVVFACCSMLAACSALGDLDRATQWCRVADDFMQQYGCPFLHARCRAHYGGVLVARGRWSEAEEELRAALDMAEDAGPGPRAEALAHLADLRFRQGRLEEAESLLADSGGVGAGALAGAAIRLARGEAVVAVALLERRLEVLGGDHVEVAPTLAALVDARLASGAVDAAAAAAARLEQLAAGPGGRRYVAALATLASARVAAAQGRGQDALALLARALEHFGHLGLPLEAARVRLELAGALAGSRPEVAVLEAEQALAAFERLGAATGADAAAARLRSLGAPTRAGPRGAGVLSRREQEVLRLVGLGLSNPEIAQRLFISRKTASHHVSHVLEKLGLRNRAEAVAYAARTGAGRP